MPGEGKRRKGRRPRKPGTPRFRGNGLYLLDAPDAALSPQRQLAALARIHDLARDDSQFVIATHSPILMAYPDAWIYSLGADGVQRIAYEDTEHFRVKPPSAPSTPKLALPLRPATPS